MAWPGTSNSMVPKALPAVVMAMPAAADDGAGLGSVVGVDVVLTAEEPWAPALPPAVDSPQAVPQSSATERMTVRASRRWGGSSWGRRVMSTASLVGELAGT